MKRFIKLFILLFIAFINVNVFAKEDVYIKDAQLINDSITGDVEILDDPVFDDMNLKLNIRFYDLDSSVKYKVTIKNDSDKSYKMTDKILDNNDDSYIKYYYSYDNGNTINGNSTKSFYVTVKYENMVPTNILDNGNYSINKKIEVNLIKDLINPETSRNIIISIVFLLMIISSLYFVKKNKNRVFIIIFILLLFPLSIRAINSITITMNNEIEVYNNMLRSFYGYVDGNDDLTFLYEAFHMEEYEDNIISIDFINNMDIPDNSITSWDLSDKKDNTIIGYLINDSENTGKYKMYIGSNHKMYGNPLSTYWFGGMATLKNINFNNLYDTSRVTNMKALFYEDSLLESLDVSNFNTSNVTNMSRMFDGTRKVEHLNLSNFDTSKVTNMRSMFYNSISLKSLDVSSFDTSKVTDMSFMFGAYNGEMQLEEIIGINKFKTDNVTGMHSMFQRCIKLKKLDLSSFNTSNVTDMAYMFLWNASLEEVNLSSFNTEKVTTMAGMFHNCGHLKELDLSSFNTKNVTDMSHMFNVSDDDPNGLRYGLIKRIIMPNFDFSSVTNMIWFADTLPDCSMEFTLNLPDNFNTSRFNGMFGSTATASDAKVIINYIGSNENYVDYIIANKYPANANIIKGECVDCT